jgi:regulator of protease activity HflC (stomatin/prohibitin superfamily)
MKRSIHFLFKIVPQQTAVVVERLGKFNRVLTPGLNVLIPFLDYCEYQHSLKEEVYPINNQMAITKDSVTLHLDGVLYLKVTDPKKASYGVSDPVMAMIQIAQTTMRSELGKYNLDQTFEERENLNSAIVDVINEAGKNWGIECMRYEIRDIIPPANIKKAMELEGEAERQKRASILDSEKERAGTINLAEGRKMSTILRAEGEAEAVIQKAKSIANSINVLAESIKAVGGKDAIRLKLAEEYVEGFRHLAEKNTTVLVPRGESGIASMVAQALAMVKRGGFEGFKSEEKGKSEKVVEKVVEVVKKVKVEKEYDDPILNSTDEEEHQEKVVNK